MFTFLLIVQTLVAASMVAVILMQRSEGGALGVGGSPSGMMSARGAADFLTRATAILATLFVILSIVLAGLAAAERAPVDIDPSLVRPPAQQGPPLPGQPVSNDPLAGAAEKSAEPPQQPANGAVPLAQ